MNSVSLLSRSDHFKSLFFPERYSDAAARIRGVTTWRWQLETQIWLTSLRAISTHDRQNNFGTVDLPSLDSMYRWGISSSPRGGRWKKKCCLLSKFNREQVLKILRENDRFLPRGNWSESVIFPASLHALYSLCPKGDAVTFLIANVIRI